MEKTLFALSLGFAGVIFATHAGWSAPYAAPSMKMPSAISFTDTSKSAQVIN